jgi:hypothetical protein
MRSYRSARNAVRASAEVLLLRDLKEDPERALEEHVLVAQIARAAQTPGGWRAAAWLLERRHPQRWGDPRLVARKAEREDELTDLADPFREVDELARRRRRERQT